MLLSRIEVLAERENPSAWFLLVFGWERIQRMKELSHCTVLEITWSVKLNHDGDGGDLSSDCSELASFPNELLVLSPCKSPYNFE